MIEFLNHLVPLFAAKAQFELSNIFKNAAETQRHFWKHLLGVNVRGVTPVPIPNTAVKPS